MGGKEEESETDEPGLGRGRGRIRRPEDLGNLNDLVRLFASLLSVRSV